MNDPAAKWWWDKDRQQAAFRAEIAKFYSDPLSKAALEEIEGRVKLRLRTFRRYEESAAFLYELARRTVSSMKYLRSWPALPTEKRRAIAWSGLFPPRTDDLLSPPFAVAMRLESVKRGPAWTDPMAFSIRLSANDGTIVGAFKRWIRIQRKVHQVENPERNIGHHNRDRSWQYLELLDQPNRWRDHAKTSMRSKALEMGKELITSQMIHWFKHGCAPVKRRRKSGDR